MTQKPLSWISVVRLGLVQSALGAVVALTTSTLNRVMVVEFALPAMLPAAFVGWHYAIQLSRPRFGYGSDFGRRRTPWIVAGMAALALGAVLATNAALLMPQALIAGLVLGLLAFTLIGAGVGAAGTSLLALLAERTAPERRPAAAALAWILMIAGIVVSAGVSGALLDPFSAQRLALVAAGVAGAALLLALAAIAGVEGKASAPTPEAARPRFGEVLREIWAEPVAARFTVFVFVSMLAYSAQDLILEPFAGLLFEMTPGQSTQLASVQHAGVLVGMTLVGLVGARFGDGARAWLRAWIIAGCVGSACALAALAAAANAPASSWPLALNVFVLGFANGVFAVAAISSMMGLAGRGKSGRAGVRMGVWGAAQAIAFALGGFLGAAAVDALRVVLANDAAAFASVFAAEAGLFILAAWLAMRLDAGAPARTASGAHAVKVAAS